MLKKENIQCVYKLYFINNPEKVYIGSTQDFKTRITSHFKSLLNNKHPNLFLQQDFNKYGVYYFRYEILEQFNDIDRHKLLKLENQYIEKLQANINGYNKATSTSSKTKNGVKNILAKELNMNQIKKYVEKFISSHDIEINKMTGKFLKNEENKYSNFWYSQLTEQQINSICLDVFSYSHNYIKDYRKSIAVILDHQTVQSIKNMLESKSKRTEFLRNGIKRLLNPENNKYKIKHIILLSSLNPYHLDSHLLKNEEDKMIYKIFTLIRYIDGLGLNKKFIIYLPTSLYELYKGYFKENKDKIIKITDEE